MTKLNITLLAAAALGAAAFAPTAASAMPAGGLGKAASQLSDTQQVRWVCGPFRCFWRPNYYGYGAYAFVPRHHFYGRRWWGGPFYGHRWGWGW